MTTAGYAFWCGRYAVCTFWIFGAVALVTGSLRVVWAGVFTGGTVVANDGSTGGFGYQTSATGDFEGTVVEG